MIKELGVTTLKLMGFSDITCNEVDPSKYKNAREKVRKLNYNLYGRSKEIKSSSTTDTETIEMMKITFKDTDRYNCQKGRTGDVLY